MVGRLENKVAIVTGAGRGIGAATAWKLAQEGAAVTIAEVDAKTGAETAQALADAGHKALFAETDITNEDRVRSAVEQTVNAFGGLHVLVNNAGKNFYFDATTMTGEEWDEAMSVDVKGAWLCCKHSIPHMIEAGGGSIVNVSSIHARMTVPSMFPYAAAKAALVGMTRNLALDWGHKNVRVNAVCPGWVKTYLVEEYLNQQPDPVAAEEEATRVMPLKRMSTPDEIANFIAFLASDEASYITGAEMLIDGGLHARFAT